MSNDEPKDASAKLGSPLINQISNDEYRVVPPSTETTGSQDTLHDGCPISASPASPPAKPSPEIISFSSTDPEHPNNWPRRKKALVFIGGIMSVINSTLGTSLPSGAITFIAEYFHITNELQLVLPISCYLLGYVIGPTLCGPLSENFGRRPIMVYSFILFILSTMACAVAPNWPALLIFRLFCGVNASAPIACVSGLYADIFGDPRNRGVAMAWFMAATIIGPVIAPFLSGFIAENTSWRWVFGAAALFAAATLPVLLFMPESYLPVLLSRKAARLRAETGNPNIVAKTDQHKKSFSFVLTTVMTRPYRMLFQELIVSCVCIYCTLAYAIFYLYFEAYPTIFFGPDSVYKFSAGLAGLTFIPIGIGGAVSAPIFLWYDSYLAKARKRGAPWASIEEYRRLPLACIGGPLYVVALFWIGWSARTSVHWIVPTLSGIAFGMGFVLIFMALLNYLSDAYLTFAASAQGIASTCRSIGGAVLPLASKPMFRSLGIPWACSLLAFLSLAVAVIPFAFIRWGERIRASSKFCLALKEELRREREDEERDKEKETNPLAAKTDDEKEGKDKQVDVDIENEAEDRRNVDGERL